MSDEFRTAHCPVPGCDRGTGTQGHRTRHPETDMCLPHRAAEHTPPIRSKHDLETILEHS